MKSFTRFGRHSTTCRWSWSSVWSPLEKRHGRFPSGCCFRRVQYTLEQMIESLTKMLPDLSKQEQTVIMDAGIATKENIEYLKRKKKLHYIVVNRGKGDLKTVYKLEFGKILGLKKIFNKAYKIYKKVIFKNYWMQVRKSPLSFLQHDYLLLIYLYIFP